MQPRLLLRYSNRTEKRPTLPRFRGGIITPKNYAKAGEVYQWVLALDPNNQQAHEIMGKALIEQNKSSEALDFLQKSLQRFPNNSELRLQRPAFCSNRAI